MTLPLDDLKIAVVIPCYNESLTIAKVVGDFKQVLPRAEIIVFDNNSRDESASLAEAAGARVIKEKRQGKGFVVASMLKKVTADLYVMVDGDDTYPAPEVLNLLQPLLREEADMVVGQRLSEYSEHAFRSLHVFGNHLVCWLINLIFNSHLKDPMSGYRVFTHELAQELPVVAFGFDVETEMTIQLLYRKFIIKELPVAYRSRPKGSVSKLRTFKDGFLVIRKIFSITRAYKPLTFFGGIGILLCLASALAFLFAVWQSALLTASWLMIILALAMTGFFTGLIFGAVGVVIHTLNFRLLELSSTVIKSGRKTDE